MKLTEIPRAAVVAWCPCTEHANYIATGSILGSLDSDFSSSAKIEIFDTSVKQEAKLLGVAPSADRFTKISWGNPAPSEHALGVIAGSMVDGSISLFDPAKILEKDENVNIATLEKHTAAVKGLEFNPKQSNLLASAGEDSQLYIWNLKNPKQPTLYTLTGKNPHTNQTISALAWNRVFEYILATTSYQGTTVIWDLKQKKPLVPFSNSQRKKRYSALAWNPEQATLLATASEDDNMSVIEIWDVRQTMAPVKELEGHTKGILSIAWCPDDSNLLLSCGRDNKTLIWNPNTGEILKEQAVANSWMYDAQWSSRPSFFSTASFDNKISVYSLQDSSAEAEAEENGFSHQMGIQTPKAAQNKSVFKTAPKWIKRPCGATFSFGRMVQFDATSKTVTVSSVVTEDEFASKASELENVLKSGDYASYCEHKSKLSKNDNEKAIWDTLRVLFDKNKETKLLEYFGFDKEQISKEIDEKITNSQLEDAQPEENVPVKNVDELVRRSIMVANFDDAVRCCLAANRMEDALVLAACGGKDLWEKTKNEYFARQQRPIMKVIAKILGQKFDEIIAEANLDQWKDTLAVLSTFAAAQFAPLCAKLGARLETEQQNLDAASVCYMLSGNVDKVVEFWIQTSKDDSKEALQELIEKVIILQQAYPSSPVHSLNATLISKYARYGTLLSEQGLLAASLRYLNLIVNTQEAKATMPLRHRVFNALEKPFGPIAQAPFPILNVVAGKPVPKQQQQPVQKVAQVQPVVRQPTVVPTNPYTQPQPHMVQQPYPQPFAGTHNNPSAFMPYQHNNTAMPPTGFPQQQPPVMPTQPLVPQQHPVHPPQQQQLPPQEKPAQLGLPPPITTTSPATPAVENVAKPPNTVPQAQVKPQTPPVQKPEVIDHDTPSNVDISGLDGNAKTVATTVLAVFDQVFNGPSAAQHNSKKKIISKDLVALLTQLLKNEVPEALMKELLVLAQSLSEKQATNADKVIKTITTNHWEASKSFIKGLKFLQQIVK